MTAATKPGGGSFQELRDRHLFLFEGEQVIHFHKRGGQTPVCHENGRPGHGARRLQWKTAGIFHYMAHDAEDAAGDGETSLRSGQPVLAEKADDRPRRRARPDDRADDPPARA